MAQLTSEAQAKRTDATRLRHQAQELKLRARGNVACSHERLGRAQAETDRARARHLEPLPSPWSALRWSEAYEPLEQTLVVLAHPPSA